VSLEASIRAADMSAIELFAVGASAASNLDPWSASVWVRVATDKAMQELPPDPSSVNPSDTHVRELAMAMHDSGGPLWATGEYALLERQKAYNMRLSTGVLYAQVRVWARLGYAEALSRQGRRDEATAELDGIEADAAANPERYTREQLMEVHWARALMWSSAGRYADAIPHLDACANDPASGHSTSALSLLVDHLCKLGRGAEAEKRYVQYLERGQPDLPTRLMYAALVEDAKYRESSGRTGKPLGYTAPPGEGNSDEAPQTGAGQDGK
jgi:hypothetical protein